ncbi:MAG TPA: alpha/beta hydrolase domain-containing protein, partial [Burkholderiales bacterium]|nr:alpha/beta hydrolase domain-containing protein [Burkholderiales bacterium]
KAQLTVRDRNDDTPSVIQPAAWEFADSGSIRLLPLGTAFRPGAIYQLTYIAKDPPVAGIGLAATRDLIAFLRYDTSDQNPLKGMAKVALAHGTSQSGRYLRDMLYRGFNETESGKVVFDGMNPHIASARIFLNHRFAQPNRLYSAGFGFVGYPDASFPFSYARMRDTISGRMDSILDTCTKRKNCPKIIQTVSSTEYWQGGHSLNTTDLLGTKDVALPGNVRIYHLAGTEHVITPTMPKGVCTGAPNTAVDARPALRAALLALDRWVKSVAKPPASRYPTIADKTLVTMNEFKVPPVMVAPRGPNPMTQFDYRNVPPTPLAKRYIALVPAVDADGNEVGGVRLPEQAVPAQTSTGWALRSQLEGGQGELCYLDGQAIPFAPSQAAREKAKDPRPSMQERYGDRPAYLIKVRESAQALAKEGYILEEDIDRIVARADKNANFGVSSQ